MPQELLILTGWGDVVERLHQQCQALSHCNELFLSSVCLDAVLIDEIVSVIRERKYVGLHLARCRGNVKGLLEKCLLEESSSSSLKLQKLSILCGFDRLSLETCQVLGHVLAQSKSLQKLTLRAYLSDDLAKALQHGLAHSQSLQELSLPVSGASLSRVQALASGFRQASHLERLKLNRHDLVWNMESIQLQTLMKALEYHSSLQELSIQGSSCGTQGMAAVARLLVVNSPRLVKLDLSNHKFGGDLVPQVKILANALAENTHLKSLSLAGHMLSVDDIHHLGTGLSSDCSGLKELCLANCNIDDVKASILAEYLPHFQTLQNLWLYDNTFGEDGARALQHSLGRNISLQQMLIPRGRGATMTAIQLQIEHKLLLRCEGFRFLQRQHLISDTMWPVILSESTTGLEWEFFDKHAARAESIFHLLREGALHFSSSP